MLKVNQKYLDDLEREYPGIRETILEFENEEIPACPHCGSDNTASVQVGVVGRTMALVRATTKVSLVGNGPRPGKYFCNKCRKHFG
jgi:hypothetical protein